MGNLFENITNILKKPIGDSRGELYPLVVDFLRGEGFKFREILKESSLVFHNQGNNGRVMCVVSILEDDKSVIFTSLYPRPVPAGKRKEIILLLTKINYGLNLGNFELGADDNFVAYQTAIDVTGTRLTPALLQHIVYVNLATIDRYIPRIHSVLNEQKEDKTYGLSAISGDLLQEYLPVMIQENQPHRALSIKDIYLAYQCPRFVYLESKNTQNLEFVSDANAEIISGIFWQLSGELISIIQREPECKKIFEPEPGQLNSENIAQKLQAILYKTVFYPYLQTTIKQTQHKNIGVEKIWFSLIDLIKICSDILVSNRYHCNLSELFDKTFLSPNLDINHTFKLPKGQEQPLVSNLTLALYKIEDKTLYIPTYPLNTLELPIAGRAKLALSTYLVHQSQNLTIDSVIEWQFPAIKKTSYSWSQVEEITTEIIPEFTSKLHQWLNPEAPDPQPPTPSETQLCQICPKQTECKRVFNTITPPPPPPEPEPEPDLEIIKELVSALNAFGVKIDDEATKAIIAPAFIRVQVKPKLGVKAITIINLADDLQVQLGFPQTPLIQPQAGYVSIDIPRSDRQTAKFENYISADDTTDGSIKVAIGVDLNGELVEADLADANHCHFLVAGTSGSGKSEFLRALALSLLVRHSPENLKIVFVDPKRVTFPEFENIPWLYSPIIKDTEPAIELMQSLVEEMESRYKLLEASKCGDLETYNKKIDRSVKKTLPRIVCIFDEYADFMSDKAAKNALEDSIKRLGAKARAAGIHLIVATQRPDAKVVTPLIRANLPARVALKTASGADSAIILGDKQTDAFRLLGKGDLLYLTGGRLMRLQSLYAENCQL